MNYIDLAMGVKSKFEGGVVRFGQKCAYPSAEAQILIGIRYLEESALPRDVPALGKRCAERAFLSPVRIKVIITWA